MFENSYVSGRGSQPFAQWPAARRASHRLKVDELRGQARAAARLRPAFILSSSQRAHKSNAQRVEHRFICLLDAVSLPTERIDSSRRSTPFDAASVTITPNATVSTTDTTNAATAWMRACACTRLHDALVLATPTDLIRGRAGQLADVHDADNHHVEIAKVMNVNRINVMVRYGLQLCGGPGQRNSAAASWRLPCAH
jgi:hypothetical protein